MAEEALWTGIGMLEYLLIVALFLCLAVAAKVIALNDTYRGGQRVLFYVYVTTISGIATFRDNIGWDFNAYYMTIVHEIDSNIVGRGELLTEYLVHLAQELSSPLIYFGFNSILCAILIHKVIDEFSVDRWLSAFVFLCFPLFYLNSFSVIRFFSALALVFYGFRYIKSKSWWKYFGLVIVAAMFHASALLGVALYPFSRYPWTINKLLIGLAAATAFAKVANWLVEAYIPLYAVYTQPTSIQEGTLAIYFFLAIFLCGIIFFRKIQSDATTALYFNGFSMGLFVYIAFYGQGTMSHRLSLFGTIFSILLVPRMISYFPVFVRGGFYLLTYFVLFAAYIFTLYVGSETYLPYKSVLY